MTNKMSGIFTIPQTPFQKGKKRYLELDEESLRSEINFCVEAGANGIVNPVMASEFHVLCEDERKKIAEITVEETKHRIPVVIGVTGVNTRMAVELSEHAYDIGADALIAMPPYSLTYAIPFISKHEFDQIFEYYKAISEEVDIPIFIQNAGPTALSPDQIAGLVKGIESIKYVKEEIPPSGHNITEILNLCGDEVFGVFGGAGGLHIIEELERGAVGNMPACEFTDILSEIYNLYLKGDRKKAIELHKKFIPLINLTVGEDPLMKEVLRRRGVIKTTFSRIPEIKLDKFDIEMLERNLKDFMKYFKVYPPRF